MSCLISNKSDQVKSGHINNRLDYEEMKQRLLETERKLQSLNRLEAEISQQSVTVTETDNHPHRGMRGREYLVEDLEREDLESIPSAISTIPGSYTGFDMNHVPASTPSKFETNRSNNRAMDSDYSLASTVGNHTKYDLKLLKQNQRLLSELERLVGDIHAANQKNATLVKEAEKARTVGELEDKCTGLLAENQAQDKALRDAERHLDEGQRRIGELQKRLNLVETDLVDTKAELSEMKLVRKEVENQRDEALHNLNDTQDSLEDYQKRTKDKMRKLEEKEDELQEALTSTCQERDDLLDQLSSMEMSLASQEAQINRLLNDVNSEDARSEELLKSNRQFKAQIDELTDQIISLEKSKADGAVIKKERDDLKLELKGLRMMAKDLRALLKMLNQSNSINLADDSGNYSFKSLPLDFHGLGLEGRNEGNLLAAELNCNNNGLGGNEASGCEPQQSTNMVCEMRSLVTNMDSELQRMRSDLKQREADDRTFINLRDELKVLMDKVESGMCKNQELSCQVGALECDKKSLMRKLEETMGCMEERDRTIQCLETRLNERSVQIVCLQEDIDERNCRICTLEKKIREIEAKMRADSEEANRGQSPALKEAWARVSELEAILLCKNKSLEETQEKLAKALKDLRQVRAESQQEIECLKNQDFHRNEELQNAHEEADNAKHKAIAYQKMIEELKVTNRKTLDKLECIKSELDEVNYAKEKNETLMNNKLEKSEHNLMHSQSQNAELEKQLGVSRNEVCTQLKAMEDIRQTYEGEMEQRDTCIRKLKDDLRRTVEELKCKMEDNGSLERSLAESRNKVQQICCQLKESDTNIQCLNIKLQEMEKLMLKEKSCWLKESEEMKRRHAQCCSTLDMAKADIDTLKQQLGEKKASVDCMQSEKTHMCGEIKKLKEQLNCAQEQLKKMEGDNQELCRQLQQKMECIRDLENLVRTKEHELKCLTKFVQDKENHEKNAGPNKLEQEVKQLKEALAKCLEECKGKSTMLCECEDAYKHCQILCSDKDNEIQLLKCQIDTLNEKLQDRLSRVDELEKTMDSIHKDVERRMTRVDEQLRKYETEVVDKIQEISTLKECINTSQLSLSEKENELSQQVQKVRVLSTELESIQLKLKDAEDTRDHLGSQLAEKKGEVADLTQQLRINREQMQKQHDDLVQSRQCLSCAQRDADKLRRDLDDAMASLEHRECEVTRLNEERKTLMEKVACVTCQMEQETCMLRQQMTETKCRMEKEMECLRNYIGQLECNNSSASQKLSLTQRQMMQMEKCCHQKLDSLNRSLDELSNKLSAKEDDLATARECMKMKDSEIHRMKMRLCALEKPCKGQRDCSNNNNANVENEIDVEFDRFHEDDPLMESKSHMNLAEDSGKNMSQSNGADRLSDEDSVNRLSQPSDTGSSRNSLGVTEVQERLRNNQLRQKEIERQLQSLEEASQDSDDGSIGGHDGEDEEEVEEFPQGL